MNASAPGSGSSDARRPDVERTTGAGDRAQDPELFEQVLQETLSMVASREPLDPAEMQALREVAERHRGQPLTLEPVARELVQSLLRVRFNKLSDSPAFWEKISLWIAGVLMEDPQAQQRLEALWVRLGETAR